MSTPKATDFFLIGNSKSGTSALYQFLRQHPSLCLSNPKEPNYFARDFCHDKDVGAFTRKTEAEYLSGFDDPEGSKVWGEASACYLYSRVAARAIHRFNPAAKLVALFREPVDFLFSYHLQMLKNPISEGETIKDFERALAAEPARKAGRRVPDGCLIPALLFYSERVKYAEQLERFLKYFPPSQIAVFIYEDFREDNDKIYRNILDFIGVDAGFSLSTYRTHNESEKVRFKTAQRLTDDFSHGRGWYAPLHALTKALLPSRARSFLVQLAYRKVAFAPKPRIDPALKIRLQQRFKPHVERFSELIDRDMVAAWGYDRI